MERGVNVGCLSCLFGIRTVVPESTRSTPAPPTVGVAAPSVVTRTDSVVPLTTWIQSLQNGQYSVVTVVPGARPISPPGQAVRSSLCVCPPGLVGGPGEQLVAVASLSAGDLDQDAEGALGSRGAGGAPVLAGQPVLVAAGQVSELGGHNRSIRQRGPEPLGGRPQAGPAAAGDRGLPWKRRTRCRAATARRA